MKFSDEELMVVALTEAVKVSKRETLPNPRVGAAILTLDEKLFFGHHLSAGSPHAEVEAIASAVDAGASTTGATMAITLEPCTHFGKTPPCVDAIIAAGIKKVLVGIVDPDERVQGKGIEKLKSAGLEVHVGLLEQRCRELNKEWLYSKANKKPYVYLKMATSLDGKWTAANGESQWITSDEAREHGRTLRAEVAAVLTSLRTIEDDDPLMNVREREVSFQPDLIVISKKKKTYNFEGKRCANVPGREVKLKSGKDVEVILKELYEEGYTSLMLESGPKLSHAFLESGFVNEVWHYFGLKYLGGDKAKSLETLAGGSLPGLEVKFSEAPKSFKKFDDGSFLVKSVL